MSYITTTSSISVAPGFDEEASRKLFFACAGWDYDTIKHFGVNPKARLDDNSRLEKINEALREKADPNARAAYGNTPLIMLSMYGGNFQQARTLLDHGAKPDIPNEMGRTPYFVALESGNSSIGEFLYSKGIDQQIRDIYGLTPAAERAKLIKAKKYSPQ